MKALLASEDVDIVLNLTIPEAHAEVSLAAVDAGKHVYSEKPLATSVGDGEKLIAAAKAKNLRVGGAPDTVLGAGVQEARRIIDAGEIGKPLTGLAAVLSAWNGALASQSGVLLSTGRRAGVRHGPCPWPLSSSTLVTLLGPVASVQASGQIGFAERTVTTPGSPMLGRTIKVETLTSVQALLEFRSGAQVTFLSSWDVWRHGVRPMELHGETGSLRAPDPNWFGGDLRVAKGRGGWRKVATNERVFGVANWPTDKPQHANYRGLGLADMARAILDRRPHRASGEVALHVLEEMAKILEAAATKRTLEIRRQCARPDPLGESEARGLLQA